MGQRAKALASTVTLEGTQSDDHWQGVAANAYRNTLPRQRAALIAIRPSLMRSATRWAMLPAVSWPFGLKLPP